jgi:hypothetical protein
MLAERSGGEGEELEEEELAIGVGQIGFGEGEWKGTLICCYEAHHDCVAG